MLEAGAVVFNELIAMYIFASPHQYYVVVAQLLTTALNSFTQSFQSRIESTLFPPGHTLFSQTPALPQSQVLAHNQVNSPTFIKGDVTAVKSGVPKLQDLITLYLITVNFADSISGLVTDPKHNVDILQSIFGPFRPLQKRYPALEKQVLMYNLNSLKPVSGSYSETVRSISESGGKIFLLAEAAVERCLNFTHAVECEGLVSVLSEVLMDYIQHLFSLLQYLRIKAKLEPDLSTAAPPSLAFGDTPTHDVTHFEGSMKLLQSAQLILQRLTSFDRSLRSKLLEMKQLLFPGEANIANQQLRNDPARLKKLLSFFQSLGDDVSHKLLPNPQHSMTAFSTAAQTLVFDIMFAYVKERLATLPHLEEWRGQPTGGMSGVDFPTYRHPLGYITRIGDHLLTTLPQQLEPYADSLARPTQETRASPQSSPQLTTSPKKFTLTRSDGSENVVRTSGGVARDDHLGSSTEEDEGGTVAHQWIAAVARGTMSLYVQQILEIQVLSPTGAKQLDADIAYLCNVLSALDVTPDTLLIKLQKYISTAKEEYADLLKEVEETNSKNIALTIANMRGIKF